jgi:hypothetical protein
MFASLALAERGVSLFMTLVSMYGSDFTRDSLASGSGPSGTPAGMAAVDARIPHSCLPTEVSVEDFLSQLHLSVSAGCCTCTLREVMGTALSQQSLE